MKPKRKIIENTLFFNELDILELRLEITSDKLDKLIIVESDATFTNVDKGYILEENWSRFKAWHKKLDYVKLTSPRYDNPWHNEHWTRNQLASHWHQLNDNDIVLLNDCDEVVRPEIYDFLRYSEFQSYGLIHPTFYFKLNYVATNSHFHVWSRAYKYGFAKHHSPQYLRSLNLSNSDTHLNIPHAGWHWSYIGDNETVRSKIRSFSHQELNTKSVVDNVDVEATIAEHKDLYGRTGLHWSTVSIDDYFPALLKQDKYIDWIVDGASDSLRRYYPVDEQALEATPILFTNMAANPRVTLFNIHPPSPTNSPNNGRSMNKEIPTQDAGDSHETYLPNVSDKIFWHQFDLFYEQFFLCREFLHVGEIGIGNGSSVRWLLKKFPSALIYAGDIEPVRPDWPIDPRVIYSSVDQGNPTSVRRFFSQARFDVIIDDGSHIPEHQALALMEGIANLKEGGLYIVEDIHTNLPLNPGDTGLRIPGNPLTVLLALHHYKRQHVKLTGHLLRSVSSESMFTVEMIAFLAESIGELHFYRRTTLPLNCYKCGSSHYHFSRLRCKCGVAVYDPRDSMTVVLKSKE